jgi:hypothetical protein
MSKTINIKGAIIYGWCPVHQVNLAFDQDRDDVVAEPVQPEDPDSPITDFHIDDGPLYCPKAAELEYQLFEVKYPNLISTDEPLKSELNKIRCFMKHQVLIDLPEAP